MIPKLEIVTIPLRDGTQMMQPLMNTNEREISSHRVSEVQPLILPSERRVYAAGIMKFSGSLSECPPLRNL